MDRSLLLVAPYAQLSLRRWVVLGRSGRPGVTPAAADGSVGVIGSDRTPRRNTSE